jgi:hypothetical protein
MSQVVSSPERMPDSFPLLKEITTIGRSDGLCLYGSNERVSECVSTEITHVIYNCSGTGFQEDMLG